MRYILSIRTTQTPHVKNCTKEYCHVCFHEIWVSPSTESFRKNGDELICDACIKEVTKNMEIEVPPPTVAQIAEMETLQIPQWRLDDISENPKRYIENL